MSGDFKIQDEESQRAVDKVDELLADVGALRGAVLYISDNEEFQSLMMWYCMSFGLRTGRHATSTYVAGGG